MGKPDVRPPQVPYLRVDLWPRSYLQDMAKAILISGAVIDIIIAGTLSYYLNQARTGIKQWVNHVDQGGRSNWLPAPARTDKIIDGLMMYTINNGILTRSVWFPEY